MPQAERPSVKLAILVLLSALGGISSMLVGYAGSFLSIIPGGSPISGQLLSGLHVFWLILSAVILKRSGSATATGALKGLIEALLVSHLGVFVLLISVFEGFVADAGLFLFRKTKRVSPYLASGFSAASNVVFLQFFLIPDLPLLIYVVMYFLSFLSGMLFGGFLARAVLRSLANLKAEPMRKLERNR